MKPYTFRIPAPLFARLMAHLFPGDADEHGAVITAGLCTTNRGTRLLVREVFLARDGVDYVPGRHGYRALSPDFIMRVSDHCARHHLCYFAVHCHGGDDYVEFSDIDLASHQRGYPALLDILRGGPVGALVFAHNAVAGRIWTSAGVHPLDHLVVIGPNHRRLFAHPPASDGDFDPRYHRQSLIFGADGQRLLRQTKIGIIGLGGAGSLISQWLAHLGVGEIIAIDYDKLTPSNQPRVVGSTNWDAQSFLSTRHSKWLQRLAWKLARHKVHVAARVARQAQPGIHYIPIVGNIIDESIARLLRDVDYIFLCADSHQSRHIFNVLVHQYLIPGVQMGAKVPIEQATGQIGDIFTVGRPVLPHADGGCLWCNELISPARLQSEAFSAEERRRQAYVDDADVTAPSVITLNAAGCAQAANDFLFGYFGLLQASARLGYAINYPRERIWRSIDCRSDTDCPTCGANKHSTLALGDRAPLPCRKKKG